MPVTLCVGAIVRAVGLSGRADLNGQRGTIVAFNDEKRRFAVNFDSGALSLLVRPENLEVATDNDVTSASAFHAVSARRETQRDVAAAAAEICADPPAGFRLWDVITITGLASKPELNGMTATIIEWKGDKGRFDVCLCDGTTFGMKPPNCVPTARPTIEGEEKLMAFAVVDGDSDFGECHLCNDARLKLVSPYLQCCGHSMCNDCAIKYQGSAQGCPFCRRSFPTSVDEALSLGKRQCSRGDPRPFYHTSACLSAIKKDTCAASTYMVALVDRGYAEAKLTMGVACWKAGFVALGTELLHSAADDGLAEAMMKIATALEFGQHGPRSLDKAAVWYQRAAAKGDPIACLNLGTFHFHGRGGVEQSYTEAVSWYRKAARLGNTQAMGNLAECLQHGRGCERNLEDVGKWLHVAATLGDSIAQQMLEPNFNWRQPPPTDFLVRQEFHKVMAKRLGISKPAELSLAELLADTPDVDRRVYDVLGDRVVGHVPEVSLSAEGEAAP